MLSVRGTASITHSVRELVRQLYDTDFVYPLPSLQPLAVVVVVPLWMLLADDYGSIVGGVRNTIRFVRACALTNNYFVIQNTEKRVDLVRPD